MDSVEIRRFGPIQAGEIDISPLTILVGPNGCGKSYAAMALHGINRTQPRPFHHHMQPDSQFNDILDGADIDGIKQELNESDEFELTSDLVNDILKEFFKSFATRYTDNIESIFAIELSELVQIDHRKIRFDLKFDCASDATVSCFLNQDGLSVESFPETDNGIIIENIPDSNEYSISFGDINFEYNIDQPFFIEDLPRYLMYVIEYSLFGSKTESHYLPAGRAGLLQSHEVVTRGAFDSLSQVGLERIELPAFSGVVSNYLSELVSLAGSEEGELSNLADEFEQNSLEGEIDVQRTEQKPHPKITFRQSGEVFPLRLASTSVSELAPLVLYSRYVLSEGSTVIVEEPGGHLHPENQRKVAYFIARLIQRGVRVIVTTHSDFFLQQINNLIRLSGVDEERRNEEGLGDLPDIPPDYVSAHMFRQNGIHNFSIERLNVDGFDAISLESFEDVSDELYGQTYKVDKLLEE